jgi:RHS repeat-associated protein
MVPLCASPADYLNGPGIDSKLRQSASGTASYFIADHLGSSRALTDASGSLTSTLNYDSFGNVTAGSPATRYTYTGRELDLDTGLMYYRARWYDLEQGRFISEDPIGFQGGVNFYVYVENDSINFADPQGTQKRSDTDRPGTRYPTNPMSSPVRGRCKDLPKGRVYLCHRVAHIPGNIFGFQHYWIKTDTAEAGLGAEGAGVPGQVAKDCPLVRTTVNDHTGECNNPEAFCEEITGANPDLVNKRLQLGNYQGRWLPLFNDCRTFACSIADPPDAGPAKPDGTRKSWGGGARGW